MFCPQCGAGLGEGARGCAACGWASSKRTLWIVLGSIAGVLVLVCCGLGTVLFIKGKRIAVAAQADVSAFVVFVCRVQVLNWAKKHGSLPESIEKAQEEPLQFKEGGQAEMHTQNDGKGMDAWGRALRYAPAKDGTYEVRSAGADGQFDSADDLAEKGSLADDLEALKAEIEPRAQKMGEGIALKAVKEFGGDTKKGEEGMKKQRERGIAPPAPAEGEKAPGEPLKPEVEPTKPPEPAPPK